MFKKTESGRSIVEMLGVLAIMGVITVMGISGYSQATARINRNKMAEDITRLAQEVRTLYAGRNSYAGLTLDTILSVMGASDTTRMPNPFGGQYFILPNPTNNQFFVIVSTNIGNAECLYFRNMAWQDIRNADGTVAVEPIVNATTTTTPTTMPASTTCATGGGLNAFYFVYQ